MVSFADDITGRKSESDRLRKEIAEKKNQIDLLERDIPKLSEATRFLKDLIEDFGKSGYFQFDPIPDKVDPIDAVSILRKGIDSFIDYHLRLENRYKIEYTKSVFNLEQSLKASIDNLIREDEKRVDAIDGIIHQKQVIRLLTNEKAILQNTILMRSKALERHKRQSTESLEDLDEILSERISQLDEIRNQKSKTEKYSSMLVERDSEKKQIKAEQKREHERLLEELKTLKLKYKKEAFEHNRSMAELDNSKEELSNLARLVGSYRDNLRTQELLGEEIENRRQRSIFNIEREEAQKKQVNEEKKTKDLELKLRSLTTRVNELNFQISQTEQKLQSQMMRIPDFSQLHQILDISMKNSQKFKDMVNQRKYLLDEIREKNRMIEQMEFQESKTRTMMWRSQLIENPERKRTEDPNQVQPVFRPD